ncbi:unnamed protein product, partial [Ectocarpus sp. 13 AM-2016]
SISLHPLLQTADSGGVVLHSPRTLSLCARGGSCEKSIMKRKAESPALVPSASSVVGSPANADRTANTAATAPDAASTGRGHKPQPKREEPGSCGGGGFIPVDRSSDGESSSKKNKKKKKKRKKMKLEGEGLETSSTATPAAAATEAPRVAAPAAVAAASGEEKSSRGALSEAAGATALAGENTQVI